MKKFLLILLFLTSIKELSSQSIGVGGSFNVGIINKNQILPFGLEVFCHIPADKFFIISTNIKSLITEYDGAAGGNSGVITKFDISILYSPFKGSTAPFLGTGIGYNINSAHRSGTSPYIFKFNNAFGYNFQMGLLFLPNRHLNFLVNLTYSYQKPKYESFDTSTGILHNDSLELSSYLLGLGVIYNL